MPRTKFRRTCAVHDCPNDPLATRAGDVGEPLCLECAGLILDYQTDATGIDIPDGVEETRRRLFGVYEPLD